MSNTKTEAQRLADELVHEATKRVCNVAMMPYSLPIDAAKELRRLDAIEHRHNEMMANPCPEWDGKAYMQAIANLRAQLAKAVAEERKPLTEVEMEKGREQLFSTNNPYCPCDRKTFKKVAEWVERHHGIATAIRARSNT